MRKTNNKTSVFKNIVKAVPVAFGVIAVFYVALLIKDVDIPVVLPVNDVLVEGKLNFLDAEDISMTVKNTIAGGYFTVDLNHAREILLQQPWIKDVSLRRQWPASVTVYVEEQKPVAYWNDEGYLNETGDVFKPASVNKKLNLPKLNGPEGMHNSVWKFMNVLYQQMAVLNYDVTGLQLDERRAWQMVIAGKAGSESADLSNGINVRLGRFETGKRMQRFVRILPALTADMKDEENKIKAIDMRYPNGFAVQMSEAGNNDKKV